MQRTRGGGSRFARLAFAVLLVVAVSADAAAQEFAPEPAPDPPDTAALEERERTVQAEYDGLGEDDSLRDVLEDELRLVRDRIQLLEAGAKVPAAPAERELAERQSDLTAAKQAATDVEIGKLLAPYESEKDPDRLSTLIATTDEPLERARAALAEAREARQRTRDALSKVGDPVEADKARADAVRRVAELEKKPTPSSVERRELRVRREQAAYHEERMAHVERRRAALRRIDALQALTEAVAEQKVLRWQKLRERAGRILQERLEAAAKEKLLEHERIYTAAKADAQALTNEARAHQALVDQLEGEIRQLEDDLTRAKERRADIEALYATDDGAERPSHEDVAQWIASLEERNRAQRRRLETDAHAKRSAELARAITTRELERELDAHRKAAREAFLAHHASLGSAGDPAWAEKEAPRWDELARTVAQQGRAILGHRDTIREKRQAIEALRERAHAVRSETVSLLYRENLLLRSRTVITWASVTQGVADLRAVPDYLLEKARAAVSAYGTPPAEQLRSLLLLGVPVMLFLLLLGRRLRRFEKVGDDEEPPAAPVRAGLRVGRSVCAGLALVALPLLAPYLLRDLPDGVPALLHTVAVTVGVFWVLWTVTGALFPRRAEEGLVPVAPRTATLLRTGTRLLLLLSLVLIPLGSALELLGYPNEGAIQLVWAAYKLGVVVLLLVFVLRRSVLLDVLPSADSASGRLLRFVVSALHPVVLLVGPAVLLLDLLGFDMLARFTTRLAVGVVGAVLLGHLAYRALWSVLDVWLASVFADEPEDERRRAIEQPTRAESVRRLARFLLGSAVAAGALLIVLALQDATLGDIRAFLSVPLPFQGAAVAGAVPLTWWNLVAGAGIIVAFALVTRYLKLVLDEFVLPKSLDSGVRYTISTLVGYVFVALGIYLGLREMFDLGNLGWIVAALSVGIGFGLQEIISNFVSGLILLFERPLKVGDMVVVGDTEGFVQQINIRSTTIKTIDNVALLIPNKDFITKQVVNYVHGDTLIRIQIGVGVAYGSDTELVRRLLHDVASAHSRVLKRPRPDVLFNDFGQSSLDFVLRCWISEPAAHRPVKSELRFAIDAAFREHGVTIPFPQRDLHLKSADAGAVLRTAAHHEKAEPAVASQAAEVVYRGGEPTPTEVVVESELDDIERAITEGRPTTPDPDPTPDDDQAR